jgi:hypothetical protein
VALSTLVLTPPGQSGERARGDDTAAHPPAYRPVHLAERAILLFTKEQLISNKNSAARGARPNRAPVIGKSRLREIDLRAKKTDRAAKTYCPRRNRRLARCEYRANGPRTFREDIHKRHFSRTIRLANSLTSDRRIASRRARSTDGNADIERAAERCGSRISRRDISSTIFHKIAPPCDERSGKRTDHLVAGSRSAAASA